MDTSGWLSHSLLRLAQKFAREVPIRLAGDGPPEKPLRPGIVIQDPSVLPALLLNPEMSFGDGYSEGQIEVEGDLVGLLENLYHLPRHFGTKVMGRWLDWLQTNTLRGSRRNIHHHYDLSNDFYRLWLDRQMVYTCAYFPQADTTLEDAQTAKMDLVCRKMWLRPHETVVEAGCSHILRHTRSIF